MIANSISMFRARLSCGVLDPRGIAAGDRIGRDIRRDDGTSGNYRSVPHCDARQNKCFMADPDVVADVCWFQIVIHGLAVALSDRTWTIKRARAHPGGRVGTSPDLNALADGTVASDRDFGEKPAHAVAEGAQSEPMRRVHPLHAA